MNKAVFLDKDGTLIRNAAYNVHPERIELYPDAGVALRQLSKAGYLLLVVTNQSGIARGLFSEYQLFAMFDHIQRLLGREGVRLAAFYFCPHHKQGIVTAYRTNCECRKPLPGLLLRAASEYSIILRRSWMIGDILDDVEAGNRAGARTVLVDTGGETKWKDGLFRRPTYIVRNLRDASDYILKHRD